ncbi:MAG: hypothetical protein MUD02_02100 [Bacteroidales bacterium]|jgi:hypothetical protein|nr:hypothetical protein [Bacteroidales bacterium]MCU0407717.1 hypothetical protein [Bacteroidales bacterium]
MSLKKIFSGILDNDIGKGGGSRIMLLLVLSPPALILVLRVGFHPLAEMIGTLTGKDLSGYYSLAALISISVISVIPGIFFAFDALRRGYIAQTGRAFLSRLSGSLLYSFLSSIISVVIAGLLADPVPSEGIIRLLLAAFLFALQSVVICLFMLSFSRTYLKALVSAKAYSVFILAAPLGLVLNSPWNLLSFFSPFYWICWSWLTEIPAQALIYGMIASGISAAILLITGIRFKKMLP